MFARPRTIVPLTLALLACRPDAATTHASDATPESNERGAEARARAQEQPSHLLLPWDSPLLTSPHADAPTLQIGLGEAGSPGRAVAVIGREGDFWQVETIDEQGLAAFAAQPIEGLDYYRIRLYVPVGVGEPLRPIPPGPDVEAPPEASADASADTPASDNPDPERARALALAEAQRSGILGALALSSGNPPVQTQESRPFESTTDFRVSPSTPVYWRDGRLAGEVVAEHAFVHPGSLIASPSGELRCFAIRVGAVHEPDDGELCFASASVQETEFVPEALGPFGDLWGDASLDYDADVLGGLVGAEIGDAWGEGGLGLVGTGTGGGGAGDIAIGEAGSIGHGGGGGGPGSGYGSGSGRFGSPSSATTIATLSSSGALDGEVGRRIVRGRLDELDACWASHAGDGKQREVELAIDIDDDGTVLSSKATTKRSKLAACIEAAAATWLFPEQSRGTLVVRIGF